MKCLHHRVLGEWSGQMDQILDVLQRQPILPLAVLNYLDLSLSLYWRLMRVRRRWLGSDRPRLAGKSGGRSRDRFLNFFCERRLLVNILVSRVIDLLRCPGSTHSRVHRVVSQRLVLAVQLAIVNDR